MPHASHTGVSTVNPEKESFKRGTPALHLNEPNWIIDGFNELLVDFLSQLALFLDPTQLQPLKNPKQIHFFWIKQTNIKEIQ